MQTLHRFFIPAIAWLIICTVLLTLPGTAFPKEDWLDKIWFDKWVHIGLFSILVLSCCWSAYRNRENSTTKKRIFIYYAIAALIYGIIMEFVQKYFIPFRSFDVSDIFADAAGCLLGLIYSVKRYIKK